MKTLLFTALTATLMSVTVLRGEIIPIPVGNVSSSSEIGAPFNRINDHLVNGSGLVGEGHDGTPDGTMWLSEGTCCGGAQDFDPWVQFDLGDVYLITSIRVWNYNEATGGNLTERGVNAVTIEHGITETLGSTVPGITNFTKAPEPVTNTYPGEVFDGFAPFTARYIRFDIDSNHNGDNFFYGLSEVQFEGAVAGVNLSSDRFLTSADQDTTVGTLTTPSGDAGDAFTYTLVAGSGDMDNSKFQIVGDELQIGPHDFSGAADGEGFSVRVLSRGAPSGAVVEAALALTAMADSDGDGLLDAWEERWAGAGGLGALSGLADANSDGDSLTDLEEFNLRDQFPGLDPTSADTDGDTLDDGEEIAGAGLRPVTDPTNPDSDGDTLSDGVETNTGIFVGPTDTGSDPTLLDTDGDTFNDDLEVAKGGDPNDPDSTLPVTLVGYWPFDGNSDPQPDLSGFANDASVVAGATWVDDVDRGGVMEFSGNDPYLEAADSESLSITGDITIAAWVKVTDYSNWRGIVGKSAGPGGNLPASYDLYLVLNDGRARLYSGSPSGFGQVTAGTAPVSGEWHHVAVTRIGDDVSFYYDGQLDGQGVTTQPMLDSDATLRIGNRTDLVTDFLGRMDDVAIFDGGLSPGQIIAIMEGDFSDFGVGGRGDPLELSIAGSGSDLVFNWKSRVGMLYNLWTSTDLAADLSTWDLVEVDGGYDIPASGSGVNTHSIPRPGDAIRFYRVGEFSPPPMLEENFDGVVDGTLPAGWTTRGGGTTVWEVGNPGAGTGPLAARSGPNCAATNIAGNYTALADVSLISPSFSVPPEGATLEFQQFIDTDEAGDVGTIRILDGDNADALIEEMNPPGAIEGFLAGWTAESFLLPASAIGRNIRIEFRFVSNDNGDEWAGFYIDDVKVINPAP